MSMPTTPISRGRPVGRRIVPSDPGRSLMLTKPTGLLPHKGGVRLDPAIRWNIACWPNGSPAARRAEGRRSADRAAGSAAEVFARSRVGATQQLIVLAHFTDGHVEDATRWAKYTSRQQLRGVSVDERRQGEDRRRRRGGDQGLVSQLQRHGVPDRAVSRTSGRRRSFANASGGTSSTSMSNGEARSAALAAVAAVRRCHVPPPRLSRHASARCRPPTKRGRFWPMPPPTSATG